MKKYKKKEIKTTLSIFRSKIPEDSFGNSSRINSELRNIMYSVDKNISLRLIDGGIRTEEISISKPQTYLILPEKYLEKSKPLIIDGTLDQYSIKNNRNGRTSISIDYANKIPPVVVYERGMCSKYKKNFWHMKQTDI